MNAPQFHWHQYLVGANDEGTRAGIQQVVMEAFVFGQMTKHKLQELDARPVVEQWIPNSIAELRGCIANFWGQTLGTTCYREICSFTRGSQAAL